MYTQDFELSAPQALIYTGFHHYMEIGQIFQNNIIKKLSKGEFRELKYTKQFLEKHGPLPSKSDNKRFMIHAYARNSGKE